MSWSGQRKQRVTKALGSVTDSPSVAGAEWGGLLGCGLSVLKPGQSQANRGDVVPVYRPHSILWTQQKSSVVGGHSQGDRGEEWVTQKHFEVN